MKADSCLTTERYCVDLLVRSRTVRPTSINSPQTSVTNHGISSVANLPSPSVTSVTLCGFCKSFCIDSILIRFIANLDANPITTVCCIMVGPQHSTHEATEKFHVGGPRESRYYNCHRNWHHTRHDASYTPQCRRAHTWTPFVAALMIKDSGRSFEHCIGRSSNFEPWTVFAKDIFHELSTLCSCQLDSRLTHKI